MSRYRNPIFAVPTFQSSVRDNNRIKELIFPIINEHKKSGITEPPDGWFTDKLTTSFMDDDFSNKLISDDDLGTEIKNQYFDVLKTFFNASFECDIADIWYNYYQDKEYQEPHPHFGSYNSPNHFACVHFLNYNPKIHSPLTFCDPLRLVRLSTLERTGFGGYDENIDVNAREGDLVMFPSYLEHEVRPAPPTPEYPRITISFNIKIHKFGDDIEENEPS